MRRAAIHGLAVLGVMLPVAALAQTATNLVALQGLATVSALQATPEGKAALDANLKVTGDIQFGTQKQPHLLPFDQQRQLALRDAFITDGNATELADGLGSRLGAIYQDKARYSDYKTFSNVTQSVADLLGYTNNITKSDSNSGKFFFANGTTPNDLNILTLFADVRYVPLTTSVRPYVLVCGGLYRTWIVDENYTENVLGYGAGVGVELEIGKTRMLFVEGRYVQGQTRERTELKSNTEVIPFRIGITWVFPQ